jgi:hypothetical protein
MKTVLLVVLLLGGCNLYVDHHRGTSSIPDGGSGCGDCDAAAPPCPASVPPFSTQGTGGCNYDQQVCTYPATGGVKATTCLCTYQGWTCDDCPANVFDAGVTCTAGDSCTNRIWYDHAMCTCDAQGRWECQVSDAGVGIADGGLDATSP